MSVFEYRAVRPGGEAVSGELQAQSRGEVYQRLERERLQPISVKLKGGAAEMAASPANPGMDGPILLSKVQVIAFTEELSDLLEAGLQLEQALKVMENRDEVSGMKTASAALRQRVREGSSFSSALKAVSASFDELYCNLISAGEISGALGQIMRRQAKYLISIHELQSRVIQALIYPTFLMGTGAILMMVFMTVLVPQLTSLFSKTGRNMPLPTKILIATSNFMAHYWWVGLILIALGIVIFYQIIKSREGRLWWDDARLKIPLFGPVLCARFYAQFCQTLATLVINGVPLLNGLKLMINATPNTHLRQLLERVANMVAEGGNLSRALKRVGYFPSVLIDMISVGEQTGDLGTSLERVALRYDKELNVRIQRLTAMVQPVVILVMALLVGLVAYSMVTGIFQAISGVKGRS
jgi:type II secretory pathway component PulF